MSETIRQIWSIVLLSIAWLIIIRVWYLLFLKWKWKLNIKENKNNQKTSWEFIDFWKVLNHSWDIIKKIRKKGMYSKIFMLLLWMTILWWISYLFSPLLAWAIWAITLCSTPILLIGSLFRGTGIGWVMIIAIAFIWSIIEKKSSEEIMWYVWVSLYLLIWPLIILAIIWWLYWVVRFIKWAWKD